MTDSTGTIKSTSEILSKLDSFDKNSSKLSYKRFLASGEIWRSNSDPLKTCQIETCEDSTVSAFCLRFDEFGRRCVRSHKDDFLCSTGAFLADFSPESEIVTCTTFISSIKSVSRVSREEAVSTCSSIVEREIDALCHFLDEEKKELLTRVKQILLIEMRVRGLTA
jgi:hypothetical protein